MTDFAELIAATNYSFLRGASHAKDMVGTAIELGYPGIGIADRNSVAGVVRAYVALKNAREKRTEEALPDFDFKLIVGARLVFADGTPDIIAYPMTRKGWGRLTRLLTTGNLRAEKGGCILRFDDLLNYLEDLLLIVMPVCTATEDKAKAKPPEYDSGLDAKPAPLLRLVLPPLPHGLGSTLSRLAGHAPDRVWLGATAAYRGDDARQLARLNRIARIAGVCMIATNEALYATPKQRPLHDILTCILNGTTITNAGYKLEPNAERHLKSPAEMKRLFRKYPQAIVETTRLLSRIDFTLEDLKYEYPHEPVPLGKTPNGWLVRLTMRAARDRYKRERLPEKLRGLLREEFKLIRKQNYAYYFLTVHDVVAFARRKGIYCQGRGSAANSVVCFMLDITSVDPMEHSLLFSRFVSEERKEPPDIDVDFEHERREEVMQYVYDRYGRHRAGIAATVAHYRPRSAVREVGKVLGLTEDITNRLTSTVWGSYTTSMDEKRLREAGFETNNVEITRLNGLVRQLMNFPRHLSQHVGGFVLTEDRLDETVPIHNAAMIDRTFIEWDKDDIDALCLMKVDILALGMLTCIHKAFDMMRANGLGDHNLEVDLPADDPEVYKMLCKGDSVGVFQVESRAQMNMLPRLRPKELYDLVIQVAIVRPGPIQGNMVHPYLRRRQGIEEWSFPSPAKPHPQNELHEILAKTLGVPLFQEQAMKLAIVAAEFTPAEANKLRRAMATFRNVGTMPQFEEKMVGGMMRRGYEEEFARRCFEQIKGFGSYGFPESHALSFARLVYVSSWIKCHFPNVFCAALLNSQPMGFYAPAQIVRDAQEHGVEVLPVDVNFSIWDTELESGAVRLGFRQIEGFRGEWAERIVDTRPFVSIEGLARDTMIPGRALQLLADADALRSLALDRREGLWEVRRTHSDTLPLFAAADARELAAEPEANLPVMPMSEHVAADYQTARLSLKGHPMAFLRETFAAENILTCAATSATKNGARVKTAGVVLVRQRPGKGNAIFVTIEDETGVTNIVIWARLFELQRREVMAARLMMVEGELQRSSEGVVHLMASRVYDRTDELKQLSEAHDPISLLSQADEFLHPQHPRHAVPRGSHPRDARILPKSRDFH
ncbi:DNA polymerase III subunit alpha (plasmid) [Sphingomonas paeninsulae]|uniref:Error-prone DNA polymerase n=1 Tax=Sphingomonas paeninsulae TaxID=2319844 RepID=A0A494TIU6_SPHPE|nr:error-prone DNA polymerase [Sphingomonas paeninsulae]AYJ85358.1 DNA polymerase III subunit alpha [Sphingomonas paeninsulae]